MVYPVNMVTYLPSPPPPPPPPAQQQGASGTAERGGLNPTNVSRLTAARNDQHQTARGLSERDSVGSINKPARKAERHGESDRNP